MTSIAGRLFNEPSEVVAGPVNRMLAALPAFGPARVERLDRAMFGRSLSVRLPEDIHDRQPVLVGDRFMLVADVRLDNRDELISALAIAGSPSTIADADLLMAAWARWADVSLDRLVGDFAFAIYDRLKQSITLARDRTGQRPLFFSQRGRQICFASMPSGILAASLGLPDFNREWLATTWSDVDDFGQDTAFAGVHRISPGEIVKLRSGTLRRSYYWRPRSDLLSLSDNQFVETYDDLFRQAVAARTRRKSGALGVYLSSGFDSSVVAVTAAHLNNDGPTFAYTNAPVQNFDGPVPRDRVGDESRLAAETAAMHGLHHRVVRATGHPLTALKRDSLLIQEPDRNIVNMDWFTEIRRAARQDGVSTILSGAMGNLTVHFGGLGILRDWRRQKGYFAWARQAYLARKIPGVRATGILYNSFADLMPMAWTQPLYRLVGRSTPLFDNIFLRPAWRERIIALKAEEHRTFLKSTSYDARLALLRSHDPGSFNLGGLVASGVDDRDPTSDHRLIDFGFRLPPDQLLKGGVSRPLLRRANANRLPKSVLNNKVRGLQSADWYEHIRQSDAFAVLEEVRPSAIVQEMLDLAKLEQAIVAWPRGGWDRAVVTSVYRRAIPHTLSIAVFAQLFEAMMAANSFDLSRA